MKTEDPGVDSEAQWIKKTGKLRYGYRKHLVTDVEGMIAGVRLLMPVYLTDSHTTTMLKRSSWLEVMDVAIRYQLVGLVF